MKIINKIKTLFVLSFLLIPITKINAENLDLNIFLEKETGKFWYIEKNIKYELQEKDYIEIIKKISKPSSEGDLVSFDNGGYYENLNKKEIILEQENKEKQDDVITEELEDFAPFSDEIKIIKSKNILESKFILNSINQKRELNNLNKLKEDNILIKTSEDFCLDTIENNYFSHNGKDGSTPRSRAIKNGSNLKNISEIIYYTSFKTKNIEQKSLSAMDWWMDSKTHKSNILNKDFKYIGVGVCQNQEKQSSTNFVVMFGN